MHETVICALCRERVADKKNTHYLTDGIIRSCLNIDGGAEREKGFYFDLSTKNTSVEVNFQRNTPVDILEDTFKRSVSDEEIKKAMTIPFSSDNVFCGNCEKIFTEIESNFINKILPEIRSSNLSLIDKIELKDVKCARLFFCLQIWRTSICDNNFKIDQSDAEIMRNLILDYKAASNEELNKLKLSISYLETLGGAKGYTTNHVGIATCRNPNIIFFNDFILQFYDSKSEIKFEEFYGLNSKDDFLDYYNQDDKVFAIKVIHNKDRLDFFEKSIQLNKAKETLVYLAQIFESNWLKKTGKQPSNDITNEFISFIVGKEGDEFDPLKYTDERIKESIEIFLASKIKP